MTVTIDNYKKLASGESCLKMKEFHDDILYPVKQNYFMTKDGQEYLLQLLLCFVNIALEKRLQIEQPIEDMLFRLFLKTKKFLILHQVVQNSVILDRYNIAVVLCELGCRDKRPIHEGTHS